MVYRICTSMEYRAFEHFRTMGTKSNKPHKTTVAVSWQRMMKLFREKQEVESEARYSLSG